MTLLSIIAIIASVLAGMVWIFSILAIVPYPKNPQSSALKQILCKALNWLDLEDAPAWRRILFKILFSALIIAALGCGFYDTYSSFSPENRDFFGVLGAIIITAASFILIFLGCIFLMHPIETLSNNYLKLDCCDTYYGSDHKSRLRKCIAINSVILCLWIAVFAVCLCTTNAFNAFSLIALSAFITAIICIILTLLGCICYLLFLLVKHLVFMPFLFYIQWLKK